MFDKVKWSKDRWYNSRYECISHYSNNTMKCAYCEESHMEFLTLDHINADAKRFNESMGINSAKGAYYPSLKKRGFPEGFQVLCMNCNQIKGSHITSKGINLTDRSNCPGVKRICYACKKERDLYLFRKAKGSPLGYGYCCLDCSAKSNIMRNKVLKLKLLEKLGTFCVCCKESVIEKLSIEHSNNDGKLHRKYLQNKYKLKQYNNIGGPKFAFYYLKCIEENDIWEGLEILCHNCNHSRAHYGYCPHQKP